MKKLLVVLGIIILLFFVVACAMYQIGDHSMPSVQYEFSQIHQEISDLDFTTQPVQTPSVEKYRKYYQLHFDGAEHTLGTFVSGEYQLAVHIFRPSQPKGTIFLLHGYIDHTGLMRHLIQNCLDRQFVVATYDLPGHGLSTGERAAIDEFSEYLGVFEDFLEFIQPHVPQPHHLISHSTGSAIAFDYLSQTKNSEFQHIIFLAPLVRYVYWHLSKVPYFFGQLLQIQTVPRRLSKVSSDPAFLEFVKVDPLQPDRVPMKWITALHAWNQHIDDITPTPHPVLILQGTRDTVVDWEYNIPFLQQKLTRSEVVFIDDAGHQLLNESLPYRTLVFNRINAYLENEWN